VSQSVCMLNSVACWAREARGGAFIASKGNLSVRVLETRTYPNWGLNMSGQALWNLAWELDKSDSGDLTWVKTERTDISGLGAGHV
jgi:hypothetical protein